MKKVVAVICTVCVIFISISSVYLVLYYIPVTLGQYLDNQLGPTSSPFLYRYFKSWVVLLAILLVISCILLLIKLILNGWIWLYNIVYKKLELYIWEYLYYNEYELPRDDGLYLGEAKRLSPFKDIYVFKDADRLEGLGYEINSFKRKYLNKV